MAVDDLKFQKSGRNETNNSEQFNSISLNNLIWALLTCLVNILEMVAMFQGGLH